MLVLILRCSVPASATCQNDHVNGSDRHLLSLTNFEGICTGTREASSLIFLATNQYCRFWAAGKSERARHDKRRFSVADGRIDYGVRDVLTE
jgi:hypothetical protein